MSETQASVDATTTPAPQTETTSPTHPAPQETPANGATPGAVESNAQNGSGAGEPQAANPEGQQGDEARKPKSRFQERIDTLTAEKRSALRDVASLRAELAELRKMPPPPANASLEQETAYEVKKAVREERVEQLERQVANAEDVAWRSMRATFEAKAEAVADRMPNLVDRFSALPEVSQAVASFVVESEKGAEVAHFLAENASEATRISRLHPLYQGIELARLEARLSVAPPVRNVSTAPPPPPTVTGNAASSSRSVDEFSVAEMQAHLKKKGVLR